MKTISENMKKITIEIAVIAIIALAQILAFHKIHNLKEENARLISNQEILHSQKQFMAAESQKYKVSDSLNAMKISELQFTLEEYKKYRADDLQLIKQLNIKKSDLQKVISSQVETINNLSAKLNNYVKTDTASNIIDTLKYFSYSSKWTDALGYIDLKRDSISMQIKNRESLKFIETTTYKRFLGFLWKTSKIKNRQVSVISENPNTEIVNLDCINIKR